MICNWFNSPYAGTPMGIRHAVKGALEQPVFSLRMAHLSGLALKILYKRFKHPKNVATSVHDSAACTPTR